MHASNQLWHTDAGENVSASAHKSKAGGYWIDFAGRVSIHFDSLADLNRFVDNIRRAVLQPAETEEE